MRHIDFCNKAPTFDRSSRIRGSGKVPRETRQIKHNLYVESDTLSRSDYEPIKIRVLYGGPTPLWERCRVSGSGLRRRESPPYRHNLFAGNEALSLGLRVNRHRRFMGEEDRP
jgi:hypothetical protein